VVVLGFDRVLVSESLLFGLVYEACMAGLSVLILVFLFPFLFGIKRQAVDKFISVVKVKFSKVRSR
jgi:hypothetical protein